GWPCDAPGRAVALGAHLQHVLHEARKVLEPGPEREDLLDRRLDRERLLDADPAGLARDRSARDQRHPRGCGARSGEPAAREPPDRERAARAALEQPLLRGAAGQQPEPPAAVGRGAADPGGEPAAAVLQIALGLSGQLLDVAQRAARAIDGLVAPALSAIR